MSGRHPANLANVLAASSSHGPASNQCLPAARLQGLVTVSDATFLRVDPSPCLEALLHAIELAPAHVPASLAQHGDLMRCLCQLGRRYLDFFEDRGSQLEHEVS